MQNIQTKMLKPYIWSSMMVNVAQDGDKNLLLYSVLNINQQNIHFITLRVEIEKRLSPYSETYTH